MNENNEFDSQKAIQAVHELQNEMLKQLDRQIKKCREDIRTQALQIQKRIQSLNRCWFLNGASALVNIGLALSFFRSGETGYLCLSAVIGLLNTTMFVLLWRLVRQYERLLKWAFSDSGLPFTG